MEHITSINDSTDTTIVKQLALALADLALLMHAEWPTAVADLTTRLSGPAHTRTLLEVLTVLPEETNSQTLRQWIEFEFGAKVKL